MVTVSRIVSVPDGNVSCSSNIFLGSLRTNCTQGVRYETAYDNVMQTVDTNAQARNAYIGSCARRQCTVGTEMRSVTPTVARVQSPKRRERFCVRLMLIADRAKAAEAE